MGIPRLRTLRFARHPLAIMIMQKKITKKFTFKETFRIFALSNYKNEKKI
jgi:hypothetical protein